MWNNVYDCVRDFEVWGFIKNTITRYLKNETLYRAKINKWVFLHEEKIILLSQK